MLQNDPDRRITSFEALKHEYFCAYYEEEFAQMYTDDDTHLGEMLTKLNAEYIRLDMEKLKRTNDENEICKTEDLKVDQSQEKDDLLKLIMRTPVITGRTRPIDCKISSNHRIPTYTITKSRPSLTSKRIIWKLAQDFRFATLIYLMLEFTCIH